MSRKGNCWDNAVAELFYYSLKAQLIHHRKFQNMAEAEQALFNYIEVYYNRQRKHSTRIYDPGSLWVEMVESKKSGLTPAPLFCGRIPMIGNVRNAIHGTYHAISRKHLPRYLAEFCYRFNHRFQLDAMIERLAYVALRTPPLPQRLLTLAEVQW